MFCFCICSNTPGLQLLARAATLEIASFTAAMALEAVDPTAATSLPPGDRGALRSRFAFFGAGELAGPRAQTSARLNSRFNCCMNCLRSAPALLGGPNLGRTTRYTH